MGSCLCNGNDEASKIINAHMSVAEQIDKKKYKLLLLGAGSSGKSTLLRQLKYLYVYKNEFPKSDKIQIRDVIFANIIDIFRVLCIQCKILDIKHDTGNDKYAELFCIEDADVEQFMNTHEHVLTSDTRDALIALSKDSGILNCHNNRAKFTILDNSKYFLANIDRIINDDYLPNFNDVIYSRSMTTGLTKEEFVFERKGKKEHYEIMDVGGQRSERNKWIQAFDNVICVMFVIALSGYNQMLFEDHKVNRLREGIELFEKTLKTESLQKSHFVLFANKRDLFEIKIKQVPFTVCFDENEYKRDPHDPNDVIEWLRDRLTTRQDGRIVYFHVTCAADTSEVDRVFGYVHDIIVRKALVNSGFV